MRLVPHACYRGGVVQRRVDVERHAIRRGSWSEEAVSVVHGGGLGVARGLRGGVGAGLAAR